MDDIVTKYYANGNRYVGEFKYNKYDVIFYYYFNIFDKYVFKIK
jgi:hypothetical protein